MKKMLIPVVFAIFSTAAIAQPTPEAKALIKAEMQQAKHLSPMELNKELQAGKKVVLLDIRQKSERPIMGALSEQDIHIPRGFLEIQTYSKITDKNAEIVVFCGKGIRSAFAANTLTEMGYKNVKNLKGGVKAWKESGLKTLQPK